MAKNEEAVVKMAVYEKGYIFGRVQIGETEISVKRFAVEPGLTASEKEAQLIKRAMEILNYG